MNYLTRTFHPVGQGAFYSERFSFPSNQEFLTIYDCGTDLYEDRIHKNNNVLKGLIKRLNQDLGPSNKSTKKHDVDLLFISHFDEDHVCGVPYLNPKVVVIPLMSKDEITLYEVLNTLQVTNVNLALLQNPKQYFGNGSTIVGIKPEIEEGVAGETDEIDINEEGRISPPLQNTPNTPQSQDYPQTDVVLPSGSVININQSGKFWQYIAFNPILTKLSTTEFNNFKAGLAAIGMNWDTLADDLKKGLDDAKIKALKNIYRNTLKKDLNSTSLLVYSGPSDKFKPYPCYLRKIKYASCNCICCHRYCDLYEELCHRIACMYFGDWRLTQKAITNYYSTLPHGGNLIGTIQVAHHGSRYNLGHYALKYLNHTHTMCVISHGDYNRHKHPSNWIISELMKLGGNVVLVTDNCSSSYIAIYEFTC